MMSHQNLTDEKLPLWKIQKHTFEDAQVFNNNVLMKSTLSKNHTDLFFSITDCAWESYDSVTSLTSQSIKDIGLFGKKDTSVYMTLSHNFCRRRTSGTQATASINKSFQVCDEWKNHLNSHIDTNSDYCSTCSVSTGAFQQYSGRISENLLNPEIYFFGKKKEKTEPKGMGSKDSHSKLQKSSQTTCTGGKGEFKKNSSKSSIQSGSTTTVKKPSSTKISKLKPNLPVKKSKGAATASGTSKTVTIKDEKSQKPCPALGTTKGDMMVTVSHIKIGPKETCPVHGNSPCQGPKCVLASSGEEQGSVKVTTVSNPRKGVFEVVIRRLTGAPLAKNELMLEWTPPPSRPLPCNGPCPLPYIPARPCRHSKCKLIVCKPSPCKPKCSRKKPCGQACYRSLPCKRCCKTKCFDSPCHSCKSCPPKSCCSPSKCIQPCKTPCGVPCKSSPCLKPCPVGRKKPRKSRSQPRIKSHHKKHSPCYNRSKACPVVRCRSVPGPCIMHCGVRPPCLPRNYISVLPCKLKKASMESCLKSCSSCCG